VSASSGGLFWRTRGNTGFGRRQGLVSNRYKVTGDFKELSDATVAADLKHDVESRFIGPLDLDE
jgi:hypothetical protein